MADPIIGKISVGDGATFTPAVDSDGVISWTNNKNLPNPASVDIPQAVMDRYQIAPIASPAFTGNPTAPTQAKTDNSTKLATTAYVQAVVADYLELTGGSITGDVDITGDLSVSGTITGNVTGNLTGNADTATNATNDANGDPISGTYLPLAGGTVTNSIEFADNSNNAAGYVWQNGWGINIASDGTGGSDKGAWMTLNSRITNSVNQGNELGNIVFTANDGVNNSTLIGRPSGSLTWSGKEIERVNSSGTNYIRYENGIQICWGLTSYQTVNGNADMYVTITFSVPFINKDYTPQLLTRYSSGSWQNHTLCVAGVDATSINLYIKNNQSSAYNFYFSWFIIGKWK